MTVLELTSRGRALQRVSRVVLENDQGCLTSHLLTSRFLLALDDREGFGRTDHCVSIYDLQRGTRATHALADFLSEETIGTLEGVDFVEGLAWRAGGAAFAPEHQLFYPSRPAACREYGMPFVVMDLRDGTCAEQPDVPLALPERCVPLPPVRGIEWQCELEEGEEPDWNEPFAYPPRLLARVSDTASPGLREYLGGKTKLEYRLDPASGDYALALPGSAGNRAGR